MLDGRAWTAGELARHAEVAPSTATAHLNRLVAGGLLVEERQGRHRYLRLAGHGTAELIEGLAAHAPRQAAPVRSLAVAGRRRSLAHARTCYDRLAGELGVGIADGMTERGLLTWERGLALTEAGARHLAELGVVVLRARRRPLLRSCLDWTERRPHVAGVVGAALCSRAFEAGWIVRIGGGRAVALTDTGRRALSEGLGIPSASAA